MIAKSFDKTIELSHQGINQYMHLPEYITNNPQFDKYQAMQTCSESDSGNQKIYEFLKPSIEKKFIDLGCCLNLINRGYAEWESKYYGIDISKEVIGELERYIAERKIVVGALVLGDMGETFFENDFFDIGACIGSLEYYEQKKVHSLICEFCRILKPGGRLVLDIPYPDSEEGYISRLVEEYLGRKDDFNMTEDEFDILLHNFFEIKHKDTVDTIVYYLEKK